MGDNLRTYARNTQIQLIAGFFGLVFLVGEGLIYLLYGQGAALLGLLCLLGALVPVGIVALILWLADRFLPR